MNVQPLIDSDRNQALASDPSASAWVSANAGTGKTEVLVRRVLRLLLAGSPPERVLCLTYTKAAAAEMQNRLLKELSGWATVADDELAGRLQAFLAGAPGETELKRARRLFACTLEAKGGLKIYTIHGFCERLLQRFPLEAQVAPHFSVLDEREQATLRNAAIDAVISRAAAAPEAALGRALAKLVALASELTLRQAIALMLSKRRMLTELRRYHGGTDAWAEIETLALKRVLGVGDAEESALQAELATVLSDEELDTAIAAFAEHQARKKTDGDAEDALRAARAAAGEDRISALGQLFLKGDGGRRARLCTDGFRRANAEICGVLDRAQERFVALGMALAHVRLAEGSGALLALADAIQAEYERLKREEGALDYDDLIEKSLHLLSRQNAAEWVLFKIDGGIDHILVDEAQDTNPEQWTIIERLAEEFFAGRGASDNLRTLFAVGDEKQSIYSFQGADPTRFVEMGRSFGIKAPAAGQIFHAVPLTVSFRSVPPVLEAVDRVFAEQKAADGLIFVENTVIVHHPYRKEQPGFVEVWETEKEEKPAEVEAFKPWLDEPQGARSVDALCQRVAAEIRHWLDSGEDLEAEKRKIRAGDILILVRRRDPFTTPMIRALKHAQIPVAGADRMRLTDQLAVQDLMALADFLLLPEDDLALAVVLKSPFFNLDDEDLLKIAPERRGSLWSALRDKAKEDARFTEAEARLRALLSRADLAPPYEFFSEFLGANGEEMRKRLITRLGPEAAEAIEEFLETALAYDRDAAPSLQGFTGWLRNDDIEIKRDMEQDRDEVRIMTVHGAKGLQAPIVFLPDTCMCSRLQGQHLFRIPRSGAEPGDPEHLAWPPPGHSNVDGLAAAKALAAQMEAQEYHRLLYVAMTRARDRLYISGWTGRHAMQDRCWYQLIEEALAGYLVPAEDYRGRPVRRLGKAPEHDHTAATEATESAQEPLPPLPLWATTRPISERPTVELAPSRLGALLEHSRLPEQPPLGPGALSARNRFARGRIVHALLQYLPEVAIADRERAARKFIAVRGTELDAAEREMIVAETLAILAEPRFAALFGPGSLAEVPVIARIGAREQTFEISGQIDRLAVSEKEVLILDYKTNRPPPKTPEQVAPGYIAQLAAYRLALRLLYPDKCVRAALLWTDGPRLMEIPSTFLDEAAARLGLETAQP